MNAKNTRPGLLRPLAAALLLVATLLAVTPTTEAATTRVLAINNASAQPLVPFAGFDSNPIKLFDVNGDGKKEIIAQNDNQWVYVFDSITGKILAQMKTVLPSGWGARSFNGPEVGVLSEGGSVKLVVANSAAYITMYRYDPGPSTSVKFVFIKEWERRLNACYASPGMDSKPVLADLDNDGRKEILAATEESGIYALRDNGATMWQKCISGGNAEPTVGDLNLDGKRDVVFGSDGGIVTAMRGLTGSTLWTFDARTRFGLGSGSMPVGAAIAQLDGVGGPDVVVGARDSHDATNWDNDHALLLALNSNGQLLWGRQDPDGNPLTYTRPIVVDLDGNGRGEVYWGDWNTMGHKPPFDEADAWKRLGPAHFYRYDHLGNLVWRQTLDTFWSNKDLALADVDADGVQEVLANGPASSGHDGIWYLDSRTGAKEAFVDLYPWQLSRAPVVADLWNTGTMQWVVEVGQYDPSAGGPGILVYDTHVPYSSAWPHIPDPGDLPPPPPPPPPAGDFNATFTIKSPNAWWQEVFVQPDQPRTMSKVEVRINGEEWRSMTLRSWGAWTSSYNAPAGTRVEFLATDTGGFVSQSEPFTWMDGDLSNRNVPPGTEPPPPPPPPPGAFEATYNVSPNSNEWWVEVGVTGNEPINAVDARVNGGSWTGLTLQSWGNWAKSFFVARGSQVEFRATSSTGAQNVSQSFTWLGPPDGGGGDFTATFEPRSVGNDWWVEVKVTANRPLSRVDANVNGGSWTALNPTSWGTWAKSFFVANGSEVRFRATSDDGAVLVSGPVTWT